MNLARPVRFAAVDCGTNTFTMLVVDVLPEGVEGEGGRRWRECFRLRLPVRLGAGGFKAGMITPERFARGLDALGVMRECARNLGVGEVVVVGTSALRGAANGAEFVERVWGLYGLELRVIDGGEEARLIHLGASAAYEPAAGERVLTLDIGGGSVEAIVWSDRGAPLGSVSTDAGVGRVAAIAAPGDPLGEAGARRLAPFLSELMEPIRALIEAHRPQVLLGAAGSFDTFADCAAGACEVGGHRVAREVGRQQFAQVVDRVLTQTAIERLRMPGMAPDRVDFMPISGALVTTVLGWMDAAAGEDVRVVCSPFALREGLVEERLQGQVG